MYRLKTYLVILKHLSSRSCFLAVLLIVVILKKFLVRQTSIFSYSGLEIFLLNVNFVSHLRVYKFLLIYLFIYLFYDKRFCYVFELKSKVRQTF